MPRLGVFKAMLSRLVKPAQKDPRERSDKWGRWAVAEECERAKR